MNGQKKKIIALPMYGIGDVLMTTPALRNMKEKLGAHITYLHMFRTTYDILQGNPCIDENIHFDFLKKGKKTGAIRLLLSLRGKFDASINFYPSNRKDYNLAALIVGAPVRIGHHYRQMDLRELNFLKNRTIMEDDNTHNVEENLRLLKFLGIMDPVAYPLEIHLSEEESKTLPARWLRERGLPESQKYIGFHAGSSAFKDHIHKRWPAAAFSRLIDMLSAKYPEFVFLLFGGAEELDLKKEIKTGCRAAGAVFTAEFPGIRQTAGLMGRCSLFITNDSGLMHVSAALQRPTVAIFGPTNPVWLAPWKCPSAVVRAGYDCGPCFRYSPAPVGCTRNDFACLKELRVEEVMEKAELLLGGSAP